MTGRQLIAEISKMKNIDAEVMQSDLNSSSKIWEVTNVRMKVSDGEFPEDYNMPKGCEYIKLS